MVSSLQATLEPDPNKRHIENARLAAMFQGVLALIAALVSVTTDLLPAGTAFVTVVNAVIMFGFAQGFAHRSRVAAVLCICFQVLGALGSLSNENGLSTIVALLIFGYFFVRGTVAIFEAHARPAQSES